MLVDRRPHVHGAGQRRARGRRSGPVAPAGCAGPSSLAATGRNLDSTGRLTPASWRDSRCRLRASAAVFQSRVVQGLSLRVAPRAWSSSVSQRDRSGPWGKYCRGAPECDHETRDAPGAETVERNPPRRRPCGRLIPHLSPRDNQCPPSRGSRPLTGSAAALKLSPNLMFAQTHEATHHLKVSAPVLPVPAVLTGCPIADCAVGTLPDTPGQVSSRTVCEARTANGKKRVIMRREPDRVAVPPAPPAGSNLVGPRGRGDPRHMAAVPEVVHRDLRVLSAEGAAP